MRQSLTVGSLTHLFQMFQNEHQPLQFLHVKTLNCALDQEGNSVDLSALTAKRTQLEKVAIR